ncbi:PREDICTED: uncharacterized protein LOC107171923, partial [Diuraphis noxia]|uniref:uncharacterized protein LOC107171923 n=1 Tax=Diuraphis noxia TaxID=143948 RepID=UPI000763A5A1
MIDGLAFLPQDKVLDGMTCLKEIMPPDAEDLILTYFDSYYVNDEAKSALDAVGDTKTVKKLGQTRTVEKRLQNLFIQIQAGNIGVLDFLTAVNNVVTIENGMLREVNKDYKKTKHKYQIILESISIIQIINNNEMDNGDLPIHKYTSAAELNTLPSGMIIDVIGVCYQLDSEKTVNAQNQQVRKGHIMVDSTLLIEVKFFGDKVDTLYAIGSTLSLISAKYVNFKGYKYLIVESSSFVKCGRYLLLIMLF